MRILHMSSERGWRGGEQQLAYLLDDLSRKDVKNVMAVKAGSRLEDFAKSRQIPCYTTGFSNPVDFFSALKIKTICRRERIDLIHLHSSKAQGIGVLSSSLGNTVPMVLSRRVAFLPGNNWLSKWKYNHRRIRKIICVSEKIVEIMRDYVKDPSKCVTVYSGIDLDKFAGLKRDRSVLLAEFGLDAARKVITTVGAIDSSKDHVTFVDTIELLLRSAQPVQALIVGDGPLAEELKNYVRKKSLERYVKFAGHRKDVLQLLFSSDIFLMTSKEEGLGTSLLDAFLARIPVVATAAGGIPEIVRHEQTGLLAPVRDAGKLSGNISRLLTDAALRDKLADQAFSFVQRFSKEATTSNTFKVYEEVLRA